MLHRAAICVAENRLPMIASSHQGLDFLNLFSKGRTNNTTNDWCKITNTMLLALHAWKAFACAIGLSKSGPGFYFKDSSFSAWIALR